MIRLARTSEGGFHKTEIFGIVVSLRRVKKEVVVILAVVLSSAIGEVVGNVRYRFYSYNTTQEILP
jgi:hypothetical protein